MKQLLNIDNIDQIKLEYFNNQNSVLCKKYDCCDETLRKFFRKNNIECKKKAQHTKNENFFHNIDSEEKAYFLGFICADGSINNDRNKLSITLNTKDIDILLKLKFLLKTTAPVTQRIYSDKRNGTIIYTTNIQIYSKKIVSDLNVFGVNENKSNQLRLPKINEILIRHFLRGLFDGDGHIGKQCSLISTCECLDDIVYFLNKFNINVNKYRETINEEKNIHKIYFSKDRIKLLNLLYDDSNIYLGRKYFAYLDELNKYDNEIINTNTYHSILLIDKNIVFDKIKECANYLKINYWTFMKNLKRDNYRNKYEKYEKIIIKTKRNGEKIINRMILQNQKYDQ
jgi:hypothetical protein